MLKRRILILALLIVGFTASGASLDINDSDPLQYYSDGDIDFEVYSNGTANIDQNLALGDGSNISNYFDGPCGEFRAVQGINPNGTWVCTEEILEEETESLNETLNAGNIANISIYMNENDINQIGTLRGNGEINTTADFDFRENNIQDLNAIQDGGSTDSLIFDESNNLFVPNGDLDLEGSTINDTSSLQNDGALTIEGDSGNTGSGNLILQTGASDRFVLTNDGQLKSFGNLNLTQNELDQTSRIDFFSNGNNGFIEEQSGDQLAINSQGDILRLQSANSQEISAESTLNLNENPIRNIDALQDGSGTDSLILDESNNLDIPNGDLNLSGNQIRNVDALGNGTARTLEIESDADVRVPNGNFKLNDNSITSVSQLFDNESNANFFQNECSAGSVIAGINADGTYDCASSSSQVEDIWVNESGDTMTGTLNMTGDQIIEIGNERSNFTNSGGLDLGDRLDAGNNDIQNAPQIQNDDSIDLDIDSNSNSNSQTLEITRDGESQVLARFNENGKVEIQDGNLNLEENSVENVSAIYDNESTANFFQNECSPGNVIKGINADGTYDCASSSSQVEDIWVNETGDNMTGNLDMNDNDLIEVDEFRTGGSGSDTVAVRDVSNGNDIARFSEGGEVRLPNGNLNLKQSGDAGNNIVNVDQVTGRDNLNLSGEGSTQGVALQQGDGTTILDAGIGNTNVEIPNGDLDLQNNNVDDVASIDGGGDEVRADDGINMNQNNVSDVKKVGFGDGSKIKSDGGRMCIGNRCS